MYQELTVNLSGLSPLLMHCGQMSDPLNDFTIRMKAISKLRNKTDEHHEQMARIEWEAGLYLNDKGAPCIPGENIESMFIAAAKKQKMGPQAKAGIICDGNFAVVFDGPKGIEALYEDGRFSDRRSVCIQRARIMRTRPIFYDWQLKFKINYLPDQFEKSQVAEILDIAGRVIGLGDYRPRFGRFLVDSCK